jgi:hypothetical protein
MGKHAEELIASILEEHARCTKDNAELEAKSLFRLLNYCHLQLGEDPEPDEDGAAKA